MNRTIGALIAAVAILLAVYNGIPWATKHELAKSEAAINQTIDIDREALNNRLDRIELRLDQIWAELRRK